MANSHEDLVVNASDWTDVYAATGIAVGTAVIVHNKDRNRLLIQIKATKPVADNNSGVMLDNMASSYIDSGEAGLFVKAVSGVGQYAVINVQEQ